MHFWFRLVPETFCTLDNLHIYSANQKGTLFELILIVITQRKTFERIRMTTITKTQNIVFNHTALNKTTLPLERHTEINISCTRSFRIYIIETKL